MEGSSFLRTPPTRSPLRVTALVLAKNEQNALPSCLDSLLGKFDQILVVDSQSTDATREICRQKNVDVVEFVWDGNYPKKKQWSLSLPQIKHQWVLMLDADERVTDELVDEINSKLRSFGKKPGAFDVELEYHFAGQKLKHGHTVVKRILVNKQLVHFPVMNDLQVPRMWEVEGHYQPIVEGRVGSLKAKLLHHDEDPLYDWFERHNRYSDWEAYLRQNTDSAGEGRYRSRQGEIFRRVPAKPIIFFIYSYIVKRGFLDGRAGFDYALANSFYYWQISLKDRQLRHNLPKGT